MGDIKDMTNEDIRKYYSIIEEIEKDLVKVMNICGEETAYSYTTSPVYNVKSKLVQELGERQISPNTS